jgi:LDH2 family malate/lactate/ureidoglycolate dehydrogenase
MGNASNAEALRSPHFACSSELHIPRPTPLPEIGCGQFFIAIDPDAFSGGAFARQVTALVKSITGQDGARMPNARRTAKQSAWRRKGCRSTGRCVIA